MKNTSEFGDVSIRPLAGQFDLRSVSGTMPVGDYRIVLNASMNELGKRCRRPQWRKFGTGSPYGFNNQDLHDTLSGLQYYCDDYRDTGCVCPAVPDCLQVVDYEYGVVLSNCVEGQDSDATAWDGTIPTSGDCSWGFTYGYRSFGGKDMAVILSLGSCVDGIDRYRLEINVRLEDNTALIVWAGETSYTPIGTYERVDGCDATHTIELANCDNCVEPVITANIASGSTIFSGSYVSFSVTENARIFFTTDGSDPDKMSELYTGPFPLNENTTIKAIAYSGTCVGVVEEFDYIVEDIEDFTFIYTCDDEDQSGTFDDFYPNEFPDNNWQLTFSLPEVDIIQLAIYTVNEAGEWDRHSSWATKRTIYPPELDGESFESYPLVIFDGGNKIADDYTPAPDNLIDANPLGTYTWMLYGQPAGSFPISYYKLVLDYREGSEEKQLQAIIPADCVDYPYS